MIKTASHVSWPPVAGELALFDSRDGNYHVLNGSASEIWRAIAAGQDIAGLAGTLATAHGVSADTIAADIAAFVVEAREKGLLVDE